MINRRTLISLAAACALSAGVAGAAAAMPDSIDGPVPETTRPDVRPATTVGADEIGLFQGRSHRTGVDRVCEITSPGEKALDRAYRDAGYERLPTGTTAPAWFDALFARSDALNKMYWLGAYASLAH
jgi:hypothetical protein